MNYEILTESTSETEAAGAILAKKLSEKTPDGLYFVCLFGDLGAGKTAFVRGFASVLSPGSRVKSPSYTVVNEYRGKTASGKSTPVFHFDLYRLEDSEEGLEGIGFDDYVSCGHCIIEWSEYLPDYLRPENAVCVKLEKCGGDRRKITVEESQR